MRRRVCTAVLLFFFFFVPATIAKPPVKSKFYNFNEQLIDGHIRKPTVTYVDHREKAKFERLLKLKKSFLPKLFQTARERVFK